MIPSGSTGSPYIDLQMCSRRRKAMGTAGKGEREEGTLMEARQTECPTIGYYRYVQ